MSNLSTIIELSETNANEQNGQVLDTVANFTSKLASFVDDSNVIINGTVSIWLRLKKRKFNKSLLIMMVGCSRRGGSCKLHPPVGSRKHRSGKQLKVRTLNNMCKGYGIT